MAFYSQYHYDWNVLHVEGICDVIDFILLIALVVHYYMNSALPRPSRWACPPPPFFHKICDTLSSSRCIFIEQRALPTRQHDIIDLMSRRLIAGPLLMAVAAPQGANCTSGAILGFSILLKDTLACSSVPSQGSRGFEPATFQSLDHQLYLPTELQPPIDM